MYHDKMMSVAKIHNGYLLEIRAPFKHKEKDDEENDRDACRAEGVSYGEKEVYAKDAADLGKKIELLMPMLDEEFASEGEFEAAFKMMN